MRIHVPEDEQAGQDRQKLYWFVCAMAALGVIGLALESIL